MNYKETKAPVTTVTYDKDIIESQTENIYEAISIISKRAVQINTDLKTELVEKLEEFATYNDSLEEVFENKEQIEVSKFYEKLPKPTAIAVDEWLDGNISSEVYDDQKVKSKEKEEDIREKIKELDVEIDRYDDVNSIDGWMDLMKDELYKDWSLERFEDKKRIIDKYIDWVSIEYLEGDNIGKKYRVKMKVSVRKKGYGIEFENVLDRGSQYRVESMMQRLAKPANFIPVSPSVQQRAR